MLLAVGPRVRQSRCSIASGTDPLRLTPQTETRERGTLLEKENECVEYEDPNEDALDAGI